MRSGIHGRDRVPVVEDDDLPFGAVGNGGRSAVYAKALPSVVREPPQRTDKPHNDNFALPQYRRGMPRLYNTSYFYPSSDYEWFFIDFRCWKN